MAIENETKEKSLTAGQQAMWEEAWKFGVQLSWAKWKKRRISYTCSFSPGKGWFREEKKVEHP